MKEPINVFQRNGEMGLKQNIYIYIYIYIIYIYIYIYIYIFEGFSVR